MLTRLENLLRNTGGLQGLYHALPLPLRQLALDVRSLPLVRLRYSSGTFACLDALMERDSWSRERLEEHVQVQMERLFGLARAIPFYRRTASGASSVMEFPVLTREQVRQDPSALVCPGKRGLIRMFTSGTSGSGLPVLYDEETYIHNWAYGMKQYCWAGVDPRDWRISFFGSRVVPLEQEQPPFWMKNHPERQYMVSIFHMTEKNMLHYARFLEEHQGMILEGFPTVLYPMARAVRAMKGKIKFRAVFCTGEPLYPFMRQEIEETFGAKVYDSYGMTEWAGLILECRHGGYHVLRDCGHLEIHGVEGEEVSPGREGSFVWTGFTNSSMPFIRYRIGDQGVWEGDSCSCGMPYPLVRPTLTRESDCILCPSGKILSPRAVNQVLKNKVMFRSCQFVQEPDGGILVLAVPDGGADIRQDLEDVVGALRSMTGGLNVRGEVVAEPLRRGGQGKIPLIMSNISNMSSQLPAGSAGTQSGRAATQGGTDG